MHNMVELEEEVKGLKQRIVDLECSLTGKEALLEARHLVWDEIIKSVLDFRPYRNMMEDKDALACKALHKCVLLNETLLKQTSDVAHSAINLLNTFSNE